jgi:hypothetical protein
MPYIIPGRNAVIYDSKGNYYGYMPTGNTPQCTGLTCPAKTLNKICPIGAIGCTRPTAKTCPVGYTCKYFATSPWTSCSNNNPILF